MSDDESANEAEIRTRERLAEAVASAHAGIVVSIQFERDDNDIDEVRIRSSRFMVDDLTSVEMAAGMYVLETELEDHAEDLGILDADVPFRAIAARVMDVEQADDDVEKTGPGFRGFQ